MSPLSDSHPEKRKLSACGDSDVIEHWFVNGARRVSGKDESAFNQSNSSAMHGTGYVTNLDTAYTTPHTDELLDRLSAASSLPLILQTPPSIHYLTLDYTLTTT